MHRQIAPISSPLRAKPMLLALLVSAFGLHTAQAQSSYTMSTLSVPSAQDMTRITLDNQDRVTARTTTYRTYWSISVDSGGPYFLQVTKPTHTTSRWPASTASTVSPSKLALANDAADAASPDGNWLHLEGATTLVNPATGVKSKPANALYAVGISTDGALVAGQSLAMSYYVTGTTPPRACLALAGKACMALPLPTGAADSFVADINDQHEAVGSVTATTDAKPHAVKWVNNGTTVQAVDAEGTDATWARRISKLGHVLLLRSSDQPRLSSPPRANDWGAILGGPTMNWRLAMAYNGMIQPIVSRQGQDIIDAKDMSASGAVVGCTTANLDATLHVDRADAPNNVTSNLTTGLNRWDTRATPSRAFYWKDGQMEDLNDRVQAMGVTLPAGAHLSCALQINDQGSIVAQLVNDSSKTVSVVRLNARP